MGYKQEAFRTVDHGKEDSNAYCRNCDWCAHGEDIRAKARYHAKSTLHTVDHYQQTWTEYTSYVVDEKSDELEEDVNSKI